MTSINDDENEMKVNDIKRIPMLEKTKPKSPYPLRMHSIKNAEETWLSGSELKTDNSSSDDEASPEARRKGAVPKTRKMKTKKKLKVKLTAEKPKPINLPVLKIDDENQDDIKITNLSKLDHLKVDDESDDYQWRPKRGSISLPGLVSELERVEII